MSNLYGKIGDNVPTYLLAAKEGADRIAVAIEPGNGEVDRGTVIFRKNGAIWAPAASTDIVDNKELAVLDEDVDTDESETVAVAAGAFRGGHFLAGKLHDKTGTAVTVAMGLVLRKQNIVIDPFLDTEAEEQTIADNVVETETEGEGEGGNG